MPLSHLILKTVPGHGHHHPYFIGGEAQAQACKANCPVSQSYCIQELSVAARQGNASLASCCPHTPALPGVVVSKGWGRYDGPVWPLSTPDQPCGGQRHSAHQPPTLPPLASQGPRRQRQGRDPRQSCWVSFPRLPPLK